MKDGDVREFVEKIHYQDEIVLSKDRKYFFNGCCHHLNEAGDDVFTFELYLLDDDRNGDIECTFLGPTAKETIDQFLAARLWEGKTFYEVEQEMTWVDG